MGERKKRNKKRFLKKHSFRFRDKNLTSNAGFVPLHRFWQQLGGEDWLDEELGSLKAINSVYSLDRIPGRRPVRGSPPL